MSFNKDLVKECLELEDIYNLLDYLGAEPQMFSNYIVAKTICHHGDTHKLYFYDNTSLFKCYSGECGTFDVFELIQKIEEIEDLNKAVYFIVNFFNLQGKISEADEDFSLEDWNLFKRYNKLDDIEIESHKKVELPQVKDLIKYYPSPTWFKLYLLSDLFFFFNFSSRAIIFNFGIVNVFFSIFILISLQ